MAVICQGSFLWECIGFYPLKLLSSSDPTNWHSIRHILTFYLASFGILSDINVDNYSMLNLYLTFHLALYLNFHLVFYLTFYLASFLAFYLTNVRIYISWYSVWHSIWQSVWHSIWHSLWHLLWFPGPVVPTVTTFQQPGLCLLV